MSGLEHCCYIIIGRRRIVASFFFLSSDLVGRCRQRRRLISRRIFCPSDPPASGAVITLHLSGINPASAQNRSCALRMRKRRSSFIREMAVKNLKKNLYRRDVRWTERAGNRSSARLILLHLCVYAAWMDVWCLCGRGVGACFCRGNLVSR